MLETVDAEYEADIKLETGEVALERCLSRRYK